MKLQKVNRLSGELTVPGDKSISHRSVMFGSIAKGTTHIHGFLEGADCLSTISCFRSMGVDIKQNKSEVVIHSRGMRRLMAPSGLLDCGNSGTTTRLISGILSAQPFTSTLTGDASIRKRPMGRIITPLSLMGARITSLNNNGCAPLKIEGGSLHGIHYHTPVPSAQVKSAILLAGLYADGETRVSEPAHSRNHTELMLREFGASVQTEDTTAIIKPADELYGRALTIPGDISSAAYFIAAGLLVPHSEIMIRNVGINPTRDGILNVCRTMGADITVYPRKDAGAEPSADLLVRSSPLHGTVIGGELIPTLIDELPVIAVIACFADGTTVIRDAEELKIKESNRIAAVAENLTAMGADVEETEDGLIIRGGKPLHGARINTHLDHRIAMSFAVAALCADGTTELKDSSCVSISYPGFFSDLERLSI